MAKEDKTWQVAFGERGHNSEVDPATEQIRWAHIEQQRIRQKREDELEELKHKVELKELKEQLGSNKGGNMGEDIEKRIGDAAEVAAEVATTGVPVEQARDLGTGKAKVVIVKPGGEQPSLEKGGWSVLNGRPIRDPEGEYTFNQALKVAQLEVPRIPSNDNKKSLGEELTEAKQKLEALGINVGSPPSSSPRPLKEEIAEAVGLLQTLGIHVGAGPQAPLKEQVAEAKVLLETLGLSIGLPGESIENLREKFRHEEKMSEIKATREHHERLADIAADIPERIGSGMGEEMRRSRGSGGGGQKGRGSSSNLPTVHCDDCDIDFPVSPEATEATCPKCGAVYKRGE